MAELRQMFVDLGLKEAKHSSGGNVVFQSRVGNPARAWACPQAETKEALRLQHRLLRPNGGGGRMRPRLTPFPEAAKDGPATSLVIFSRRLTLPVRSGARPGLCKARAVHAHGRQAYIPAIPRE